MSTAGSIIDTILKGDIVVKKGDAKQFGVKGMRWGVRKREIAAAKSDEAKNVETVRAKAKSTKVSSLSNKEMQDVITRMNLERQFKVIDDSDKPVKQFIKRLLGQNDLHQVAISEAVRVSGKGTETPAERTARVQSNVNMVGQAMSSATRTSKKK